MLYSLATMAPFSLYLHIPFCRHRCSYCDFNTYAGLENLVPEYVRALCREITMLGESAGERLPVHTIFFGGGTPSLLPPDEIGRILQAVSSTFDLTADLEVTLEANPGTLSLSYLESLNNLGINRLSLGMQSATLEELRLLERQHDYPDVLRAVAWARKAGIENINLDLIFGLPYQDLETWKKNLSLAIDLHPAHLSLYALTLEHGTPMAHWVERGLLSEPDPDLAAEMYEWAADRLAEAGFMQYEISNWARCRSAEQPFICRHNLQYWRNLPYLGCGAGAHGFAAGMRTANVLAPAAYIKRSLEGWGEKIWQPFPITPATLTAQPVDRTAEMGETMMMGLRLTQQGVSGAEFFERFGKPLANVYKKEIQELLGVGLLEWAGPGGDHLRLTPGGRLLGNQVFVRFI